MRSDKKTGLLILLAIMLLFSVLYHRKTINEFPQHVHAWAEGDYYALALNFKSNGHNFFLPETYCLNPEFPSEIPLSNPRGITAVDFPLVPYITSWEMELFGDAPWVFRLTTLLVSLVGMICLYLLAFRISKDSIVSVFASLFAFTIPVFTYYQAGFIASIPALSLCFIGIHLYIKYVSTLEFKCFTWAVAAVTLAALMRTPFGMVLAALTCVEVTKMLLKRRLEIKMFTPVLAGFGVVLLYFAYNRYLRHVYGSVFLGNPEPATSVSDFIHYCKESYDTWFGDFLTRYHLAVFSILLVASCVVLFKKGVVFNRLQKHLALLAAFLFCGALFYAFMMAPKFVQHDYYYLDTFFLPFVLLSVFLLSVVSKARFSGTKYTLFILFSIVVVLYYNDYRIQRWRRNMGYFIMTEEIAKRFEGADLYLDSLKVSRDARMLVWESASSNNPLILMQRKGYSVIYLDKQAIEESLSFPFDFLVLPESLISTHYLPVFPDFDSVFTKVGSNGKVAVYKKR